MVHFQSSPVWGGNLGPVEDRTQQTTPLAAADSFLQPSVGDDCLTLQNVYICNTVHLQSAALV